MLGFTDALTATHLQYFLDTFREIMETPSGDAAMERKKDELYRAMDAVRDKFRAVAHCWLAPFFGVSVTPQQYERAVKTLRGTEAEWHALTQETWFEDAQAVAHDKRFFHWELEFPEIFFNAHGFKPKAERGFDAVIGNPPYGGLLDSNERTIARAVYRSSGSAFDVFGMFIEQGTRLLRHGRLVGKIVPSGWLTAREHVPLRAVVLSELKPQTIVHLPYDVFPDAYIDCIVWLAEKRRVGDNAATEVLVKRFGIREPVWQMPHSRVDYAALDVQSWLADPQKLMVTETGMGFWLRRWSSLPQFIPMGQVITVSRGITPYVEPDSSDTRQTALGFFGSIGRYDLEIEKMTTVVYDPSLMEYKPSKFFTGPRLIIRRIISRQHRIHATLATEDFVINKSYLPALAATDDYALGYVLAILNSRLLSRAFVSQSEIAKRDDFPQLDIATVQEFPLRRITFTTPPDERTRLVEEGKGLYNEMVEKMTRR